MRRLQDSVRYRSRDHTVGAFKLMAPARSLLVVLLQPRGGSRTSDYVYLACLRKMPSQIAEDYAKTGMGRSFFRLPPLIPWKPM